jgi:hypothetical protein
MQNIDNKMKFQPLGSSYYQLFSEHEGYNSVLRFRIAELPLGSIADFLKVL